MSDVAPTKPKVSHRTELLGYLGKAAANLNKAANLCLIVVQGPGYTAEERVAAGKRRRSLLSTLRTIEKVAQELV